MATTGYSFVGPWTAQPTFADKGATSSAAQITGYGFSGGPWTAQPTFAAKAAGGSTVLWSVHWWQTYGQVR